ncbi:MAG: methionine--tRNA ligase subunit beta [Candidatus Micrarchaeota archaeon]
MKKKATEELKGGCLAEQISFEDFAKLDLRIAKILKAERVEKADKLLKLTVKIGGEERTLAAGIAQQYTPEELEGKLIVVVVNLAPRTVRGIESEGMLLAAVSEDRSRVVLLSPEKEIDDGCQVS